MLPLPDESLFLQDGESSTIVQLLLLADCMLIEAYLFELTAHT